MKVLHWDREDLPQSSRTACRLTTTALNTEQHHVSKQLDLKSVFHQCQPLLFIILNNSLNLIRCKGLSKQVADIAVYWEFTDLLSTLLHKKLFLYLKQWVVLIRSQIYVLWGCRFLLYLFTFYPEFKADTVYQRGLRKQWLGCFEVVSCSALKERSTVTWHPACAFRVIKGQTASGNPNEWNCSLTFYMRRSTGMCSTLTA